MNNSFCHSPQLRVRKGLASCSCSLARLHGLAHEGNTTVGLFSSPTCIVSYRDPSACLEQSDSMSQLLSKENVSKGWVVTIVLEISRKCILP